MCFDKVIAKYGNTSNLFAHLRSKHPLVYNILEVNRKTCSGGDGTASQPFIMEDTLDRIKKLDSSSNKHKELSKSVAICPAKDMLPIFKTVEKEGFKAMLKKFNLRYDLPSHLEIVLVESRFTPSTQKLIRNWKHCLKEMKLNILQQTCGRQMQWSHTWNTPSIILIREHGATQCMLASSLYPRRPDRYQP